MSLLKFADDQTLVVVSSDAVYSYSIPARKMVRQLPLNRDREHAVILRDKILVQEFNEKTFKHFFRIFDINANKNSKPISIHPSPHVSTGMSATNDGKFVAFFWGNRGVDFLQQVADATYQIFDIKSEANSKILPSANSIQFSPNESVVAVCGIDISLFDWPSLSKKWSLDIESCHDIRFSADGKLFGALNQKNDRLLVFDTNTGAELAKMRLNPENGFGFEFGNNGTSVWLPDQGKSGGIQELRISSGSTVQRIGNLDEHRWVVFLLLLACWALLFCFTGNRPMTKTETTPSISLLLFSAAKIVAGVLLMALGLWHCFKNMALYQHTSLTTYVSTLVFTTFILLVACWISTMGFSSFTTQAVRLSIANPTR